MECRPPLRSAPIRRRTPHIPLCFNIVSSDIGVKLGWITSSSPAIYCVCDATLYMVIEYAVLSIRLRPLTILYRAAAHSASLCILNGTLKRWISNKLPLCFRGKAQDLIREGRVRGPRRLLSLFSMVYWCFPESTAPVLSICYLVLVTKSPLRAPVRF